MHVETSLARSERLMESLEEEISKKIKCTDVRVQKSAHPKAVLVQIEHGDNPVDSGAIENTVLNVFKARLPRGGGMNNYAMLVTNVHVMMLGYTTVPIITPYVDVQCTEPKVFQSIVDHVRTKVITLKFKQSQKKIGLLWAFNVKDLIMVKTGKSAPADLRRALEIVTKNLVDRNVLACQEELIDNGLEEYAEL